MGLVQGKGQVNNGQKRSSYLMPMPLLTAPSQTVAGNGGGRALGHGVSTAARRLDVAVSGVGGVALLHGWVIGRKGGRYYRRRSRMGVWMGAKGGWKGLSEGGLLGRHVVRVCVGCGDGCDCCYVLWALTGRIWSMSGLLGGCLWYCW